MYDQGAFIRPTRPAANKLRPGRVDLVAVAGIVLVLLAVAAALVNSKSHGVPCGTMFHESSAPLEADLARLDSGQTYSPDSSIVLSCAKARMVQTFLSLAMGSLGIVTVAVWLVIRAIRFNVTDRGLRAG